MSSKRYVPTESHERAVERAIVAEPPEGIEDNSKYMEALLQAAPPLLILDQKLRVQTANQSFCESFGISPDEAVNRRVYELGQGEWNIPKLRSLLEVILPRKSGFDDVEVKHKFKGVGAKTMLLSGRQLEQGQRIFLFIEDISDCREAQATIRASETHYRRLFEAAGDGILLVDPDTCRFTEANRFMERLLGMAGEELIGRKPWEIGLFETEESCRSAFRELRKKHLLRFDDVQLVNKAGERLDAELVSTLYTEGRRKIIQCHLRDITKRKRAEAALLSAKNELARQAHVLERLVTERTGQLRDVMGELEGFSYSIAHDMRAPLRAMESFASLLVDEYGKSLDPQGIDYLHKIMRAAVRLDRLIHDVLSYSRIVHAQVPLAEVDLDLLVRDIVQSLQDRAPREAHIQITGPLPPVTANEALLGQCIMHLVGNGLKFVPPGTIPQVTISAEERDSSFVRLSIRDNGLGIAPEDHDRIFRLFEKVEPEAEYEGTGVGLAIVRKAVERMGAEIGVESAPGKGSLFWIQFKKGPV